MIPGLRGPLLSHDFAERALAAAFRGELGEHDRDAASRTFRAWWQRCREALGPASSVRALFDGGAAPLMALLGLRAGGITLLDPAGPGLVRLVAQGGGVAGLVVAPWGAGLHRVWSDAVRAGIRLDARWCFCFDGARLRVVDAERSYARRFFEIDLEAAAEHPELFAILWGLCRGGAVGGGRAGLARRSLLDRAIDASGVHAAGVRASLQSGVQTALVHLLASLATRDTPRPPPTSPRASARSRFEHSLTIIYRILFLLFAEARGLVPLWHPVFRDAYSMAALQAQAETSPRPRGLWDALQAITRLAHAGCQAGDLRVTPFNGRLFAPDRSAFADPARGRRRRRSSSPRDASLAQVLLALTTRRGNAGGRERISYGDLGVEQLGAVYERVLDYEPEADCPARAGLRLRATGRRKATGTFYTPRALTDFLVRRTLYPLVRDAGPEEVLSLRVLDAAMGSGAFLVSACRYLASAYERALLRAGVLHAHDVTDADRAGWRRLVAQRCLYGVDLNPMAVQLGRLSLWLATLAADRPLTFLDHRLRAGDSLVGASLTDVCRRPPPRRGRPGPMPSLFDGLDLAGALGETLAPRLRIALEPGDTVEAVRGKERLLDRLTGPDAPLARWRAIADLWCAAWFWPDRSRSPGTGEFWALADALGGGPSTLAAHVAAPRLDTARAVAAERTFFHWTLEFPEVFADPSGRPLENPGFDAVIGNPPWEMLRADQDIATDSRSRAAVAAVLRFARESGVYALQGAGHSNLYQLFLERALALLRRGGRAGLVLPGGLLSDLGSAALRRHLLTRCDTDAIVSFDNRDAIFPIHRSYRFLLLTTTGGAHTSGIRCRFAERSAEALDTLPDDVADELPGAFPIVLTPALVSRLSGDSLAIPDLRSPLDLAIAERVAASAPALGAAGGWAARFGRELNATDDRPYFRPPGEGLPVVEGKAIRPFRVAVGEARFSMPVAAARARLDRARTYGRPRLAYRDVAGATNRLTLIAALLPAGVVSTHTVQCLKTQLDRDEQYCLCGLLNSYVANYLVRQRVGTHVTAVIMERLPVPRPPRSSTRFTAIAELARRLSEGAASPADEARLQALAAGTYGLTAEQFAHVLGTFPLVELEIRRAALDAFRRGSDRAGGGAR